MFPEHDFDLLDELPQQLRNLCNEFPVNPAWVKEQLDDGATIESIVGNVNREWGVFR